MFCFKQKTAYEMRISDWSSDVCSSDLLPRVDDRHVEPGGDRIIEEDAVHRAAHHLVAAKPERQVGKAAREMGVRTADADFLQRLDEIDRIIVMFLEPRRDGEDIGVEDDVLCREADAGQQLVDRKSTRLNSSH